MQHCFSIAHLHTCNKVIYWKRLASVDVSFPGVIISWQIVTCSHDTFTVLILHSLLVLVIGTSGISLAIKHRLSIDKTMEELDTPDAILLTTSVVYGLYVHRKASKQPMQWSLPNSEHKFSTTDRQLVVAACKRLWDDCSMQTLACRSKDALS